MKVSKEIVLSAPISFVFRTKQRASSVELAGSFNNWSGVAMEGGPWVWNIALELPPGHYQYKFIADGKWIHQDGKPTVNDNMNGLNNVIIVEDNQDRKAALMDALEAGFEKFRRRNHYSKSRDPMSPDDRRELLSKLNADITEALHENHGTPLMAAHIYENLLGDGAVIEHHIKMLDETPLRISLEKNLTKVGDILKQHIYSLLPMNVAQGLEDLGLSMLEINLVICPQSQLLIDYIVKYDIENKERRIALCKLLIEAGEYLEKVDYEGCTPLYRAVQRGYAEICKMLIEAGSDVNKSCQELYPELVHGTDAANILLAIGADAVKKLCSRDQLFYAACKGDTDTIQLIMELKRECNNDAEYNELCNYCMYQPTEPTLLMIAARSGFTEICKLLIDGGAKINIQDNSGDTALMEAARIGKIQICKLLIEEGAELNTQNDNGDTALMKAANNWPDVCVVLIEEGAELNTQNNNGETALMKAVIENQADVCEVLLSAGADTNKRDHDHYGNTALDIAKKIRNNEDVINVFKKHGVLKSPLELGQILNSVNNIDEEYEDGITALIFSIQIGNEENCKFIIEAGADVNKLDRDGKTALIHAVRYQSQNMCKMLIQAGADVDKNTDGYTPLLISIWPHSHGHWRDKIHTPEDIEIAKMLILAGADTINVEISRPDAAIFIAADYGLTDIVQVIMEKRPNMDKESCTLENRYVRDGWTPLMVAIKRGHTEICKLLIEGGVELNKKNYDEETALMKAAEEGHTEICKLLIEGGVELDTTNENDYEKTALMYAASSGQPDVCEILLSAGADANKSSSDGDIYDLGPTALCFAEKAALNYPKEENYAEVVAVLKKHGAVAPVLQLAHVLKKHGISEDNLEEKDKEGNTALIYAVINSNKDACKLLIEAGADVDNDCHREGLTPLLFILRRKYDYEIARMLLLAGADAINKHIEGRNALFFAARNGLTDIVQMIMLKEPNMDAAPCDEDNGWTPLMAAAEKGYTEICKWLIKGGVKLDTQNSNRDTALMIAVCYGQLDVCEVLLSAGADVNKMGNHTHHDFNVLQYLKDKDRYVKHECVPGSECVEINALDIAYFKIQKDYYPSENNAKVLAILEKHGAHHSGNYEKILTHGFCTECSTYRHDTWDKAF